MAEVHLPPGVDSITVDDHATHPVILQRGDKQFRAKKVQWNQKYPPDEDYDIDDERPVNSDGSLG